MTYATHIDAAPKQGFAKTAIAQIRAFMAGIAEGLARRDAYRRTLAELGALSDRDLTDLGIRRSEIHYVALTRAFAD